MEGVVQPSGTVTLVFTDIEGSTRLLAELGTERYHDALLAHREAVRSAFGRYDGYEVDTEGDSVFYAFASAVGAVKAVGDAITALEGGPIAIRVGVHTGEPRLDGRNYVGLDVHAAARIMAAGHGGQMVLSRSTRALLDDSFQLVYLGEHRLKDFSAPVELFQIGEGRFPPLRTVSNTNLPRPVSAFVGREREIAEVVSLFRDQDARLVTLVGPGGTGKTRLAIEAAAELVGDFAAGVFWVGLAPIRDPALVVDTIAQTLGARVALEEHINDRELLLVLDNLEQVVEAGSELVALLRACPKLRMVATSRELLRVEGEDAYAVPALDRDEAIELYCMRAHIEANDTVGELCVRLDNLPLAVELAAARTTVLSPEQILGRISQRLDLFRGGRDADPRQQTLRATIEWSYRLLTGPEKLLFARLGVFAGGCTLEAAEEIAEADVDDLQSLVEKSLVRRSGDRFWMLETIREFASERVDESAEADAIQRRHARYFLAFFESLWEERRVRRVPRSGYRSVVRGEQDNARVALSRFEAVGDSVRTARMVSALHPLWIASPAEGRRFLDAVLTDRGLADDVRGRVLECAASVARQQGDWTSVKRFYDEALEVSERLGDRRLCAEALFGLGLAAVLERKPDQARSHLRAAKQVASEINHRDLLMRAANVEAHIPLYQGDFEQAERSFAEVVRLAQDAHEPEMVMRALVGRGHAVLEMGRLDQAASLFRETLLIRTKLDDPARGTEQDDSDLAVEGLAAIAVAYGDADTAARLLGAIEQRRQTSGHRSDPFESARADRTAAAAQDALGEHAYLALAAEGAALQLEEAVELALTVHAGA